MARSFVKTKKSQGSRVKALSAAKRRKMANMAAVRAAPQPAHGFLSSELKFFDTWHVGAIGSPADATGGVQDPNSTHCLNCPAEGSGPDQRDGRNIQMKSIYVTGQVYATAAGSGGVFPPSTVYVALVLDKQSNGVATFTDSQLVYSNPNNNQSTAPFPLRNLEYSKRFQVLDHVTVQMPLITSASDAIKLSAPFALSAKKLPSVQFKNSTTDLPDIVDNALHVIAYTDNTACTPRS